jgi:hypothetical protein
MTLDEEVQIVLDHLHKNGFILQPQLTRASDKTNAA